MSDFERVAMEHFTTVHYRPKIHYTGLLDESFLSRYAT